WKKLLDYLWRHGLAAGVEVSRQPAGMSLLPFLDLPARVRLTLVFPEGGTGKNRQVLEPLLSVLAGDHAKKIGQRTVHLWAENEERAAWWQEGRHLVLVVGNDSIDGPLAVADERQPSLLSNPLLKSVAGFKDYETDIRGFVNLRKIVDLVRQPAETGDKLGMMKDWLARGVVLNQLGLTSLNSLIFHLGFERQYQRST